MLEVSDPETPSYRVILADGTDATAAYLGATGWPDEWRRSDGSPILPYVLHHAEQHTDRLLDPYAQAELVEGSLNHAMLMTW